MCQRWRFLGDPGKVAVAFITLTVRSRGFAGEPAPTDDDLRASGGASFKDLTRLEPQRADEIYNEFDFTDPSAPSSDPVTVSHGEPNPEVLGGAPTDFRPFVERAQAYANCYHHLLLRLGEVSTPFLPIHREWFLADRKLVAVHICFHR